MLPLLERARNGIEFFGLSERARTHFERIKSSRGLQRFAAFCEFLGDLARCTDYQLLSSVQCRASTTTRAGPDQQHREPAHRRRRASAVDERSSRPQLEMSESRFSRFFRRATGNNFIDFVNRVRINRACQLLMEIEPLHHAHLLRRRLQQRRQLQPPLPGDQGHDAERVPASGQRPFWALSQ